MEPLKRDALLMGGSSSNGREGRVLNQSEQLFGSELLKAEAVTLYVKYKLATRQ